MVTGGKENTVAIHAAGREVVMKRLAVWALVLMTFVSTLGGCFGRFSLVRKVYEVNSEVNDKYVRSLVTWVFVIVPVYPFAGLVDFILFNTIEFWKGTNPLAAADVTFRYAEAGQRFDIHAQKRGDTVFYTIDRYDGPRYVDTMAITWDTQSGDSRVEHREFGQTTTFLASLKGDRVDVRQVAPQLSESSLALVAHYR
jgi:hypothetical protein